MQVQAGHTSTVEVLKVLRAFEDETDYTVWSALHNCVARLNQLLSHTDFHHNFAAFVRNLFRKISQRLGWEAKPGENPNPTCLEGGSV
ncbi:Puromycin-sensitive aminopeptidase [Portunus trituberculatus]|uniref:Puromycin-sensitive aminopeptidase n=1 Tax=Portunus trituberculatus TaxID=210409 RepID=A0A5B7HVQ3_PORTR|nr:Puromycin-sensitive aminopeptidase [Portunus trituberculatus]